jgi:hypothetical protein
MNKETLKLLKDIQTTLAVALAWPGSGELRSRLNVAIMKGEDALNKHEALLASIKDKAKS